MFRKYRRRPERSRTSCAIWAPHWRADHQTTARSPDVPARGDRGGGFYEYFYCSLTNTTLAHPYIRELAMQNCENFISMVYKNTPLQTYTRETPRARRIMLKVTEEKLISTIVFIVLLYFC
ncbi:unnamed protein product [Leptosia nina]|uniref:Uncharacterized protein n=1 Tax=Leptosia nina TaxID=320188 RepID=A0AAV1J4L9_9NEOP